MSDSNRIWGTLMIVGIVSKFDHAKNHASALEADGHVVKILGSDGNIDFPSDLEVLVLRHLSSSHGALERARTWAKSRHIPIVAENGLSGIRMALNALRPKHFSETVLPVPPAAPSAGVPEVNEDEAIARVVMNPGKISSYVRHALVQYVGTPGLFVRRCAYAIKNVYGLSAVPSLPTFSTLFEKFRAEPLSKEELKALGHVYNAGRIAMGLDESVISKLRETVVHADKDLSNGTKFLPSDIPADVRRLNGEPWQFVAFYLWILGDIPIRQSSLTRYAYGELSQGRRIENRAFNVLVAIMGTNTYMPGPGIKPAAETPEIIASAWTASDVAVSPIEPLNIEADVLKTVQEEILNLAIRMDTASKLEPRIEDLDRRVGSLHVDLTRVDGSLRDLGNDVSLLGRDHQNSVLDANQNFRSVCEQLDSIRAANRTLVEQNRTLEARIAALEARFEGTSSTSDSGTIDAGLRALKALGAQVTISI